MSSLKAGDIVIIKDYSEAHGDFAEVLYVQANGIRVCQILLPEQDGGAWPLLDGEDFVLVGRVRD